MVALTLCEAARSPFDIICRAFAAVWVCGVGRVCAAIMHERRGGARGRRAATAATMPVPCRAAELHCRTASILILPIESIASATAGG